jgi:hypothetical protein
VLTSNLLRFKKLALRSRDMVARSGGEGLGRRGVSEQSFLIVSVETIFYEYESDWLGKAK